MSEPIEGKGDDKRITIGREMLRQYEERPQLVRRHPRQGDALTIESIEGSGGDMRIKLAPGTIFESRDEDGLPVGRELLTPAAPQTVGREVGPDPGVYHFLGVKADPQVIGSERKEESNSPCMTYEELDAFVRAEAGPEVWVRRPKIPKDGIPGDCFFAIINFPGGVSEWPPYARGYKLNVTLDLLTCLDADRVKEKLGKQIKDIVRLCVEAKNQHKEQEGDPIQRE